MRLFPLCLWVLAGSLLAPRSFGAFGDVGTEARLLLEAEEARPGETVFAAVEMQITPEWHIYWRNPGDSGEATQVEWTLPEGLAAGPIQWPVAEKSQMPPFTVYTYHDTVLLLVPLSIAPDAAPGRRTLSAKVSWMECKELCVNGSKNLSATLIIGSQRRPSEAASLIAQWRDKLPKPLPPGAVSARWGRQLEASMRELILEWKTNLKNPEFLPFESTAYKLPGESRVEPIAGGYRLVRPVKNLGNEWPAEIPGVLISGGADHVGFEAALKVEPFRSEPLATGTLLKILFFGFLGGLILNIMPCVLPIIALKILGFVNQAQENPARVRTLGVVYGLGVLASFAVLAALAIGVQKAGEIAGWSMAFQNPQFRVVITVLMVLIALNLFGVFEIFLGGKAMAAAGELSSRQGVSGAFFNGVLATVLATPCTAPYLTTAVGFAFLQPPLVIVATLLCVGLGLAAPYVVLSFMPQWLRFLPKPGRWMERFKVAMGFPMLGTAVWLFWVSSNRMGQTGVLWFGLFLVLLAMAAWVFGEFVQRGSRHRLAAGLWAAAIAGCAYYFILEEKLNWRDPAGVVAELDWRPWSPEAVQEAREAGHPVLVDFTADTCLNCKWNLAWSIEVPPVIEAIRKLNAVTFIADYTDKDPRIAEELRRWNRPGVPLVLVYPPDPSQPAIELPPVLTRDLVLKALYQAAGEAPEGENPQQASR